MAMKLSCYVDSLVSNQAKISLQDFVRYASKNCNYDGIDLSSMDYLMETSADEHEDEFSVKYERLVEYGINISESGTDLENRLARMGVDDYWFFPKKPSEDVLTPKAFKTILMSADHVTDVIEGHGYCKYYLFLEKCMYYYMKYQARLSDSIRMDSSGSGTRSLYNEIHELRQETRMRDEVQKKQISVLLESAKETKATLEDIQDDLMETKEAAETTKLFLDETKPLQGLHQYFAATSFENNNSIVVKFVSGQRSHVEAVLKERVQRDGHKVVLYPFFNSTGVDLRFNVQEEFKKHRHAIIAVANAAMALTDKESNDRLRRDIRAYNRANPNSRRDYKFERVTSRKLRLSDIPVSFKKLSVTYTTNHFMTFEELLQIVRNVTNSD